MSKQNKVRIISIALLTVAFLLSIRKTNWNDKYWVGMFVALVCGTAGSIISIFIPIKCSIDFVESDWENTNSTHDFIFRIIAKKHGLGKSPKVMIYLRNSDNTYEEVISDSSHDECGNITISSSYPFNGKMVVT